ncbi:WD40 repeat-like protein [Suillus weaverae]|nr:WD40 repeat-like protein [Suillus weaverae]
MVEGSGAVNTIALSPDGKTVASGSSDGAVRMWNISMGKVIKKWTEHTAGVSSVCWSPDGSCRVVSGSDDRTFRVWNVESGKTILGPIITEDFVFVVGYSPDGKIIATGGDGLKVWDANTENDQLIGPPLHHEDWAQSLALSPDGKTIASGGQGGTVRLWNIDTGKLIKKWTGDTDIVQSVGWSPDGCRIVNGSYDGAVRVWDVRSGETVLGAIETGQGNIVWAVSYSPNGKRIATGADGLQVWDANTGKLLKTLGITVACLAWASGGSLLIVGSLNKIKTFNTNTWTEIAVLDGHERLVSAISLSPNERILASVSDDSTARLWNLKSNQLIGLPLHHECEVRCVSFSGKFLATGCYDHHMYTWDVSVIVKKAGFNGILSDNVVSLDTFH